MSNYDKEIFNYLTQPENYRAAKEITDQMGRIDEELIRIFWKSLAAKLYVELTATRWQIDLDYPNYLSIHRDGWEHLGINCDQLNTVPDLGIHAPNDVYDRDTVNKLLEPLFLAEGGRRKPTEGWPYFNRLSFDFYQASTLESILPANREESLTRASTMICKFFNNYSAIVDRIEREARKTTLS